MGQLGSSNEHCFTWAWEGKVVSQSLYLGKEGLAPSPVPSPVLPAEDKDVEIVPLRQGKPVC